MRDKIAPYVFLILLDVEFNILKDSFCFQIDYKAQ